MELYNNRGWYYLPVNFWGWILVLTAISIDIWFFTAIDRNQHSASDTLINFLPYFVSVWVGFSYIAKNTSKNEKD